MSVEDISEISEKGVSYETATCIIRYE